MRTNCNFGLKVEEWTHKPIEVSDGGLHGYHLDGSPIGSQVFRNALNGSLSLSTQEWNGTWLLMGWRIYFFSNT